MTKVAVLRASGQIGQSLSLLLKSVRHGLNHLVTELRLYDVVHSVGVATDLNHIDTPAKVSGHLLAGNGLGKALTGAELIIIPAGIARKPGVTRDDLFKTNADVIADLLTGVATYCPTAFVAIVPNSVNNIKRIAIEVLKRTGIFNPRKVFGVTTLSIIRASTFLAHTLHEEDPQKFKIPVVGGYSGATILPLFSHSQPTVDLSKEQPDALTNRVQFGVEDIVQSKAGAGSATACMGYAGFRFAQAVMIALGGVSDFFEHAYVYLPGIPGGKEVSESLGVDCFSVAVELGVDGVNKTFTVGKLSAYEEGLLELALQELKGNITKGEFFIAGARA